MLADFGSCFSALPLKIIKHRNRENETEKIQRCAFLRLDKTVRRSLLVI